MSEPTKEAIFVTVGVSEDSWATVPKDGALTLDEAKCHALAQEFINGNVTQGTTTAMLVSAIIAHVRKKARDDALDEARELLAKPDWIRVEDALPEPGVPVIAYVPHYGGHKTSRRIRAQYAAKHSLEQHADAEGGEYDEASDTYWCEPGWYEDNEYEEIHWRVSDEVTHWQPLPQPPEGSK